MAQLALEPRGVFAPVRTAQDLLNVSVARFWTLAPAARPPNLSPQSFRTSDQDRPLDDALGTRRRRENRVAGASKTQGEYYARNEAQLGRRGGRTSQYSAEKEPFGQVQLLGGSAQRVIAAPARLSLLELVRRKIQASATHRRAELRRARVEIYAGATWRARVGKVDARLRRCGEPGGCRAGSRRKRFRRRRVLFEERAWTERGGNRAGERRAARPVPRGGDQSCTGGR